MWNPWFWRLYQLFRWPTRSAYGRKRVAQRYAGRYIRRQVRRRFLPRSARWLLW